MPDHRFPRESPNEETIGSFPDPNAPRQRSVWDRAARWFPALLVAAVVTISLLRNGVAASEILIYSGYWILTLLLPGTLVVRVIFRAERNLTQDLALGAATGLALEIGSFVALRIVGLEELSRFWWLVPLGLFVAIPDLRRVGFRGYRQWAHRGWAWLMAAISAVILMGLDIGWFQRNPLPPLGGNVQRDLWWHLSIVHEMMRPGPAQVPQVAGEILNYHTNVHSHIAVAAQSTGIDPQIVLFRLFLPPLILVAIGLMAFVGSEVARRSWAGPIAVWLGLVALGGGYLWVGIEKIGQTPLSLGSPTQMLGVPLALAASWGIILVIRGNLPAWGWAWLGLVIVIGAGSKPNVLLILLGGTLLATIVVTVTKRGWSRSMTALTAGLVLVQIWMLTDRSGQDANVAVLGTLKAMDVYREISGDVSLRGVNEGLILDSLSSTKSLTAAAITVVWLVGFQVILLVGIVALVHPATRRDPVAWWLAGALSTGWLAFLALDLVSNNQYYFLRMALPFGAILTSWILVVAVEKLPPSRRFAYVGTGLAAGAAAAIAAASVTTAASRSDTFGMIDRVLVPLSVVAVLGLIAAVAWRSLRRRLSAPAGWLALGLAFIIGISVPTSIELVASRITRWTQPIAYAANPESGDYLSPLEQEAAVWLHENSVAEDVIATNSHCHPVRVSPPCNAVGFWIGGISGRRVVLEGWAYTPEAVAMHGVDGKHRSHQPPPWPDRYALSHAAIEDPTPEVLDELRQRFGTTWLVAVRRAGPTSEHLRNLAELAFENADVSIYRMK